MKILNDEELAIVKGEQGEGRQVGIREVIARRVGIGYTTGGHTGEQIYLGVYAPSDLELLEGVVDNTEVNKYMQRVLFGEELLSSYTEEIYQDGEAEVPYINGKYFIPQELIDVVSELKENNNAEEVGGEN